MFNKFHLLSKRSKLVVVSVVLLLTVSLISLLSPSPNPLSNPPTPSLTPYLTTQSSSPQSVSGFSNAPLPQSAIVYPVATPTRSNIETFFSPLISDYQFSSPPTTTTLDSASHLVWSLGSSLLDVNLNNSSFIFKPFASENHATKPIVDQPLALKIAQDWLSQYQLMSPASPSLVQYLKALSPGEELTVSTNFASPDVFRYYFTPTLNQLPLFAHDYQPAPIIVDITNKGDVYQVIYNLPALFYSESLSKLPAGLSPSLLKTADQVEAEIASGQPIITAVLLAENQYSPSHVGVSSVSYQTIVLGYQSLPNQGFLTPVFQLSGTGTTANGQAVKITAYLPALAR